MAVIVALLAMGKALAAADPAMLSRPCAACHGTGGISFGPMIPHLAGQPAPYLLSAMKQYRAGARTIGIMARLAKAYSDEEMAAMGEFFAALPRPLPPQDIDAAKAQIGRRLHYRSCAECHKEDGRRFEFEGRPGPVLAGQRVDYLVQAAQEYLAAQRDMPIRMAFQMSKLKPADVEALAHFYASQR